MKVTIYGPKSEFTPQQQQRLERLGKVVYTQTRKTLPLKKLQEMAQGANIIAADPDPLGGFEEAKERLTTIMESLPHLKGLCLSSTSYGWVDVNYCKRKGIPVTNVPGYSRESVAEHSLALLLCLAKRIIVTDRKTQKGQYKLEMGFELKGKTLGIIGLGNIGSRVAELGNCIGMKVIAYNRSPRKQPGVKMKPLKDVLSEADAISLHVIDSDDTRGMINQKTLATMKDGVIIVNTVDRNLVDEKAMAEVIKRGKVSGYAYEAEDLLHTPLAHLENAVGIKGFGWYTKEALANLFEIWTNNILSVAQGKPLNRVA